MNYTIHLYEPICERETNITLVNLYMLRTNKLERSFMVIANC